MLHIIYNLLNDLWNGESVIHIVQSASTITIITDKALKERVIDTVYRSNIIRTKDDLVKIIVKLPEKFWKQVA